MTAWLVRWRLALRIALRDARRHRGRTALVLAMVGLPVLVVVGGDTFYRTAEVTAAEALPATLGAADALVDGAARGPVVADPGTDDVWEPIAPAADPPWTAAEVAAALPAGSRVVEAVEGRLAYGTDLGYAWVPARAEDLGDPLLRGRLELLEGRVPAGSGELVVSERLAGRGLAVGDELRLSRDDVPAEVVGVVAAQDGENRAFVVLPPADAGLLTDARTRFLADVPGGLEWPAVEDLAGRGLVVVSRQVVLDPPPATAWQPAGSVSGGVDAGTAVLALIVVSVVLEVVLLAGPAFAVGVRRQRRDLALLAATGGAAGDLRRTVLASGIVLGGGAAVLGAVLGVGLVAAAVPLLESGTDLRFGPFEVPLLDVLVTAAVGLLAGVAAAWFPARQAARADVVASLAGWRGPVRTTWRLPVLGLLVAATGAAVVLAGARRTEYAVAGGAVLLVVGVVVMTPWLVGLPAPLGRLLPVSGRLALRDAVRNRGRTAPAVAAVMATVAGVTALAIGNASDSAQQERDYVAQGPLGSAQVTGGLDEEGWAAAETVVRQALPGTAVHRVGGVQRAWDSGDDIGAVQQGCAGGLPDCRWLPAELTGTVGAQAPVQFSQDLVVADADALRALAPPGLDAAAYRALESGQAVVVGPGAVTGGEVEIAGARWDDGGATATALGSVRLPAVEVAFPPGEQVWLPAPVVVPPALVDRLPVPTGTVGLVAGGLDDPVTGAEEQRVAELLAGRWQSASVEVERGWTDVLAIGRVVLVLVGGALVLVATLTATGLALADARPDFAVLAAVGAAPRTRRLVAMGAAGVVAGVGALMGVVVGLVPGVAVAYPLTRTGSGWDAPPIVDVPWLVLGAVAVVVPLLAVGVTGLATRSRLPVVRRPG